MISTGVYTYKIFGQCCIKPLIKSNTLMSIFVMGSGFSLNTHDRKFVTKKSYIKFNLCTYYTCTLLKLFVNNKLNLNKQYNFLISKHTCFEYLFYFEYMNT